MHFFARHASAASAGAAWRERASNAERLLIVGASVRAAMASAVRGGMAATGIDLFADADAQLLGRTIAVDHYPDQLAARASEIESCDWMYTGGVENYPHVVERISRRRRLLGVGPVGLSLVRDPFRVSSALSERRLRHPGLLDGGSQPVGDRWLLKHRRSSGGRRVTRFTGQKIASPADDWYFQASVDGLSASAVFVAAGGHAAMLGVTEQHIGHGFGAPAEFVYAGSIFPPRIAPRTMGRIARLGSAIAADFGLTGLFGIDLVIDGLRVWPIEINPRYTASIEVLERAGLPSAVAMHVQACRGGLPPGAPTWHLTRSAAKQIVYARRSFTATEVFTRGCFDMNLGLAWPAVADIPRPGAAIDRLHPVVTVLADAATPGEVELSLAARIDEIQRLIETCEAIA